MSEAATAKKPAARKPAAKTTAPVPTAAQGGPVDAQGRAQYRLRTVNNELMTRSLEPTAGLGDVYRFQISLRYLF